MANTAELNMHWWQASNANLKIYLCFGNRDARAYLPESKMLCHHCRFCNVDATPQLSM